MIKSFYLAGAPNHFEEWEQNFPSRNLKIFKGAFPHNVVFY